MWYTFIIKHFMQRVHISHNQTANVFCFCTIFSMTSEFNYYFVDGARTQVHVFAERLLNRCGYFGMINFTIVARCFSIFHHAMWGEGQQKYSNREMNFFVIICTAIFSFLFFIFTAHHKKKQYLSSEIIEIPFYCYVCHRRRDENKRS